MTETKVFNFPPRSLWDIWKDLGEEKILKLIEIEKVREDNLSLFFDLIKKKENFWLFELKILDKSKKLHFSTQYWQKMQRLGAFLRARPEFATNEIVNQMRETKALKNFSNIVVFKESASGVKVPLVPSYGYHTRTREVALQKMEEIYYTNLNYLLKIQKEIIAEIYKKTKGKSAEIKKLKLKDLSYIAQRISNILESFKKKQSSGVLIKLDLSQKGREDYWKIYNSYIQEHLKQ